MASSLDLAKEFKKRGPWVTQFQLRGQTYGGRFDAFNDQRLTWFLEAFPTARTILELGSLEGGHTLGLAQKQPALTRIVGVEGRTANLDRARFVRELLGVKNVEFIQANLETLDLAIAFGPMDAVLCVGLLYHLPEPWRLVEQIARVSQNVLIWTHYVAADRANITLGGYPGWLYQEHGLRDVLSGLSNKSFWPTLAGLLAMLKNAGLSQIRVIEDNPAHPHGPCVTLTATAP